MKTNNIYCMHKGARSCRRIRSAGKVFLWNGLGNVTMINIIKLMVTIVK